MGSAASIGIGTGVAASSNDEIHTMLANLDPKIQLKLSSALNDIDDDDTSVGSAPSPTPSKISTWTDITDDNNVIQHAQNAWSLARKMLHRTPGTYCDWGEPGLAGLVRSPDTPITEPLVILEPWEHVGFRPQPAGEIRASCNIAVLARRIGLESQMVPLWEMGMKIGAEALAQKLIGKTFVFEGGEPSVHDAASFTHDCCPRAFLIDLFKKVLCMRHLTGPGTFICLSHQLVLAALVELIKDAVGVLRDSGNATACSVAQEIHDAGMNVQIIKQRKAGVETICIGYDSISENGLDLFATSPGSAEAELSDLRYFDPARLEDRPDLKRFLDVHGKNTAPHCELKREIDEDEDGVHIAMFHADENNVEAALFVNWALVLIASVREQMEFDTQKWLGSMPVGFEIVGSTWEQDELHTEVAATRVDYKIGDFYESYYTCQFHPELDEKLIDSRTWAPPFVEDGARLVHSLLRAQNVQP